jgi:hypothetical protein
MSAKVLGLLYSTNGASQVSSSATSEIDKLGSASTKAPSLSEIWTQLLEILNLHKKLTSRQRSRNFYWCLKGEKLKIPDDVFEKQENQKISTRKLKFNQEVSKT